MGKGTCAQSKRAHEHEHKRPAGKPFQKAR